MSSLAFLDGVQLRVERGYSEELHPSRRLSKRVLISYESNLRGGGARQPPYEGGLEQRWGWEGGNMLSRSLCAKLEDENKGSTTFGVC